MSSLQVKHSQFDEISLIKFDDGKANALSFDAIAQLSDALNAAESEAGAVVLAGRPDFFCAGFDLATMSGGGSGMLELVDRGAELLKRLAVFPMPVVAACTGHALAAGALLLLAADIRIGSPGNFKIGLNEVAIGLPLPAFAVELAKLRLARRHLNEACATARLYAPEQAVGVGFLDRLSEDVVKESLEAARGLAEHLEAPALAATRTATHGGMLSSFGKASADLAAFVKDGPT